MTSHILEQAKVGKGYIVQPLHCYTPPRSVEQFNSVELGWQLVWQYAHVGIGASNLHAGESSYYESTASRHCMPCATPNCAHSAPCVCSRPVHPQFKKSINQPLVSFFSMLITFSHQAPIPPQPCAAEATT